MNTVYRLDEKNYLQWSKIVKTFLKDRGQISHLNGTGPSENNPKFQAWDEEDSMVMSWLWKLELSMQTAVSKHYMFLPNAKEIWETIRKTSVIVSHIDCL